MKFEQGFDQNWENPELKEKIIRLEQLSLGPTQKAALILVLLNLKPAAELDVFRWNDQPEKIEEELSKVGLSFAERKVSEKDQKNKIKSYAVSLEPFIAENLKNLDAAKDHEAYGRMMGYPDSAIKAFAGQEPLLDESSYPAMEGVIFNFKLSKNNWPQEYKLMLKWSEAIKVNSPSTFEKLMPKNNSESE